MINLLPPSVKEQIHYAKLNRLTLRYLQLTLVVVVVLAGIFGGTFYLLDLQTQAVAADVTDKQQTLAGLNKTFVPQAKEVSDRLSAIKYVQGTQTRFSAVVADLAKVLPSGSSIDSITLTGDDALPVRIAVTTQTYDMALAFRNALVTSPRVASADLETISAGNSGTNYQASVVVAFKPGQAR